MSKASGEATRMMAMRNAVTKAALDAARSGQGPTFIEAFTYRMGAHTTSDDPSKYREFRQFADAVVRRRVIDWLRGDLGRSRWQFGAHVYERTRPELLSLDAPGERELDITQPGGESDFEAGGIDLRRLLAS